jgi:hypothetical protein
VEIIRKYESEISGRISEPDHKPHERWSEQQILCKIQKWLSGQFLAEMIRYYWNFVAVNGGYSLIWMRRRSQNSSINARPEPCCSRTAWTGRRNKSWPVTPASNKSKEFCVV